MAKHINSYTIILTIYRGVTTPETLPLDPPMCIVWTSLKCFIREIWRYFPATMISNSALS